MVEVVTVNDVAEGVDDVWWSKDMNTSTSTRAGPISSATPYATLYSARCMSSKNDGIIVTNCASCVGGWRSDLQGAEAALYVYVYVAVGKR